MSGLLHVVLIILHGTFGGTPQDSSSLNSDPLRPGKDSAPAHPGRPVPRYAGGGPGARSREQEPSRLRSASPAAPGQRRRRCVSKTVPRRLSDATSGIATLTLSVLALPLLTAQCLARARLLDGFTQSRQPQLSVRMNDDARLCAQCLRYVGPPRLQHMSQGSVRHTTASLGRTAHNAARASHCVTARGVCRRQLTSNLI